MPLNSMDAHNGIMRKHADLLRCFAFDREEPKRQVRQKWLKSGTELMKRWISCGPVGERYLRLHTDQKILRTNRTALIKSGGEALPNLEVARLSCSAKLESLRSESAFCVISMLQVIRPLGSGRGARPRRALEELRLVAQLLKNRSHRRSQRAIGRQT